ncbi:hypothetical protein GUITHDRAFT_79791 [Guillardia theta CCMP2712]|uniref:Methyltransferase small domain-containing protein n=1 Tax=Guillardia theta (strain CCMP2712) TaxID=905079 RepID=L1IHB4_GUITC|nr:hypothetical protein GUITHDRAFT_79791 [Guillardia theta CCMP2712]EKX35482.1 hypothetical protein GUITHDRAFT_79791 [Guillardia theta CCMP2712]|eukprot:XP_005822462.1 hypothetical protein GUITHDRAFT_79791 [Guillardia theta CCMP2712]
MKSQTFVFRQFSVQQDRCAMKVGTDAVLLGAWAGIPPEGNLALDIGTGTGVLCLMVAQRASKYRVHAVEIEPSCAEQANENVLRSKWSDRIEVKGCSIQSWRTNCNAQYDLIISNPPYFKPLLNKEPIDASCGGLDPSSNARRIARETLLLSHAELLQSVKMLLKKSGAFCVILPFADAVSFELLAAKEGLKVVRRTTVHGVQELLRAGNVVVVKKLSSPLQETRLSIYESDDFYTEEYVSLTREFYQKTLRRRGS